MPMVPGVPGAGLPVDPMVAMARRIQELERVQREMLPALMAAVGPAIATLNGQVSTLNDLVSNEVVTMVLNGNQNGISVPLSWTDYVPLTFTAPTGFTRCSIMASLSGSPYVTSPGGSSGAVQVRAVINGTAGSLGNSGWLAAGDQRSVSANFALTASGLTGGGSVIVKAQAIATAGAPNMDFLNLSAIAVFTR